MQNTISLKLTDSEMKAVEKALVSLYWFVSPLENEYVSLRMKNDNGSVATLYTSGKIVFQGNQSFEKEIERIKGKDLKIFTEHFFSF